MIENLLSITLIGEEITGSWNEDALTDIARVFGGSYLAYCGEAENAGEYGDSSTIEAASLRSRYDCLMAAENLPGARSVYTFRPPRDGTRALLVGNEAKGLRRKTRKQAHALVEIPLPSLNINCLNVAAAAAVLLYYLSLEQPLNTKQRSLASIGRSRPDVLLVGGDDPMELGSTLRSVCAFGWELAFLEDRGDVWYACDRRIKSEGRGTARRGRNPIRVVPHSVERLHDYRRMAVFTTHPCGRAPYQVSLTGKDLIIVLADEKTKSALWCPPEDWHGEVTYASLPQTPSESYHYRQMSAIALAEIARQLGEPTSDGIYLRSRKDRYRRALEAADPGTTLDLEDLQIF